MTAWRNGSARTSYLGTVRGCGFESHGGRGRNSRTMYLMYICSGNTLLDSP